jgi:acetyl/propionyl-CoA carboxylase alpha subunit
MKIKKLLIANRGEIARRIMSACRDLGIKTVAVYSDADRDALHVKEADEAYHIGPSLPPKSYLNIESIMGAVEESGADAVHPGYGFLAENADFAGAVASQGIIWIGPPAKVMERIESKCYCRQIAANAGVSYIPGTVEPVKDVEEVRRCLSTFGIPLLLKLDRGGGGKGIEIIESNEQAEDVFEKAQRMGQFAFNSPDCYVEQLLERPRHIEVQFLADHYGNCITLGERECSIQRRHQKIIEEAPAPGIDNAEREKIFAWTVTLVKALGYSNAGTLEFLRSRTGEFFFMEINARLQVEHAVTELVTGIDIVKNQLAIASGERLSMGQEDVKIDGYAVEARIYAENPTTFVPSPGTVTKLNFPDPSKHLRIDHALEEGVQITPYYDPLLAKIIVWGASRQEATERMKEALAQFHIEGVETTIAANQRILNSKEYIDAELSIRFLDDVVYPN